MQLAKAEQYEVQAPIPGMLHNDEKGHHLITPVLSRFHKEVRSINEEVKAKLGKEFKGMNNMDVYHMYYFDRTSEAVKEFRKELVEEIRNCVKRIPADEPFRLSVIFKDAEVSNLATATSFTRSFLETVLEEVQGDRREGAKLELNFPNSTIPKYMVTDHFHPEQGQIQFEVK